MIKHIYLYKLKDKTRASEIARKLMSLKSIPAVADVEVGIDFIASSGSFDLAEIVSCRNGKDFEAFCKDKYHDVVRAYMADKYTESYKVDFITGDDQYKEKALEDKNSILSRLHEKVARGHVIIGTGAGTGLSAKAEAEGGSDLIIAYSTGRFRMAGRSSMAGRFAFSVANLSLLKMLPQLVPEVGNVPLIAGVFVQDPFCDLNSLLNEIIASGCSGVQNIPGMGGQIIMEGAEAYARLSSDGCGFDAEVDFIKKAGELGLLTTPYCSQPEHIEKMAEAGADIFVLHMGLTGSESDHSMAVTPLDECAEKINVLSSIAVRRKPDSIILAHGGPIVGPEELMYLMNKCPLLHGFYGASSIERIPVETQVCGAISRFKSLRLNKA